MRKKATVEIREEAARLLDMASHNPPPDVLTVDQVAEMLQVSRATVYKLINEGEIPCKRVGERWRFSRQAVLDWMVKP